MSTATQPEGAGGGGEHVKVAVAPTGQEFRDPAGITMAALVRDLEEGALRAVPRGTWVVLLERQPYSKKHQAQQVTAREGWRLLVCGLSGGVNVGTHARRGAIRRAT
jgi:hypothetical protein